VALPPFSDSPHASGNAIALRTLARFLNHKEIRRFARAPINSRLDRVPHFAINRLQAAVGRVALETFTRDVSASCDRHDTEAANGSSMLRAAVTRPYEATADRASFDDLRQIVEPLPLSGPFLVCPCNTCGPSRFERDALQAKARQPAESAPELILTRWVNLRTAQPGTAQGPTEHQESTPENRHRRTRISPSRI